MKEKQLRLPGLEYPDPTPLEIPMELKRPESTEERVRRILQEDRVRKMLMEEGIETVEEASDFDVKDEFETEAPMSGHEIVDMEEEFFDERMLDKNEIKEVQEEKVEKEKISEGHSKEEEEIVEPAGNDEVEIP